MLNYSCFSCGSCGYELNLNSCNRNTTVIGSKYGKTMRRGVLSFLCIDESRFTQISKVRCIPYFRSKNSWGFFKQHTKLFCRNCSSYIGIAHIENNNTSAASLARKNINVKSDATPNWDGLSACKTNYDIKICALRPSVAFLWQSHSAAQVSKDGHLLFFLLLYDDSYSLFVVALKM